MKLIRSAMDRLGRLRFAGDMLTTNNNTVTTTPGAEPAASPPGTTALMATGALGPLVHKAVSKRSFATLATASASGRPHSAGVLYGLADGALWISTMRDSVKARNVADTGRAAITIPVRRVPVGPPSSIQAQTMATVVELNDPDLRRLAESGALKAVTGHGELELSGGCFLRLELPRRVPVYGLGMSLRSLIRNPLEAGRVALVEW